MVDNIVKYFFEIKNDYGPWEDPMGKTIHGVFWVTNSWEVSWNLTGLK